MKISLFLLSFTFVFHNVSLANASSLSQQDVDHLITQMEIGSNIFSPEAQPSPGAVLTREDIVTRAKEFNFDVQAEAERVFQAKKQIQTSIGKLLPHISIGNVFNVVFSGFSGSSLVDTAAELLPFIFPSNWFNMSATRAMSAAESIAMSSMKGNVAAAVDTIIFSVKRDQAVTKLISDHAAWLAEVNSAIMSAEENGTIPKGTSDDISLLLTNYQSDMVGLKSLLSDEISSVAQLVGLDPINGLSNISDIPLTDLSIARKVDANEVSVSSVSKSIELDTLRALQTAAYYQKRAVAWGIITPGSGVFIGFGYGAQIQVARSRQAEIQVKLEQTQSEIAQKSVSISNAINLAIDQDAIRSVSEKAVKDRLVRLIQAGLLSSRDTPVVNFTNQLLNLQGQLLSIRAERLNLNFAWMIANSGRERMLIEGLYSDIRNNE